MRTVWTEHNEDSVYVGRCSNCGGYKEGLFEHWFFTGVYCIKCIQDVLYDNARNIWEIK